jgi:hypothetical protein
VSSVRFAIQRWSLDLADRDSQRLVDALHGHGASSDPVGHEVGELIQGALRGEAVEIRLDPPQTAALFAALDRLRDTDSSFSPDLGRLRSALAAELGVF